MAENTGSSQQGNRGRGPQRGGGGRDGQRRGPRDRDRDRDRGGPEYIETTVYVNRVAKVVKGGRRFSFNALVCVGDGMGKVGVGLGKSNEISDAIRKAGENAKRSMMRVPLMGGTIPFAVHGKFGEPCPVCKTPVQRIRYASNETNYCARCQTGGQLLADRALSRLLKQDWPKSIDEVL